MRFFWFLLISLLLSGCALPRIIVLNDPLDARQHNDLGVAYEARGERDLASREYKRAAELDRGWALPLLNLGNLAAADEQWREAERFYRRALKLEPKLAEAMNNLAWVLLSQGEFEEAVSWASKAVELNPRQPAFLDTLAAAEMGRGQTASALAAVEAALALPCPPPLLESLQEKRRRLLAPALDSLPLSPLAK